MGHRRIFNTSQLFEDELDEDWNHMHAEEPHRHIATAENDSFFYPIENMSVDGVHFTSPWNPAPMSNGYASSSLNGEVPYYQTDASGQSPDPMLHLSPADNYVRHGSSSNSERRTFHAIEGNFVDLETGNGREPHKRKGPSVYDIGSSSRNYHTGSSSDLEEKPSVESQQLSWEHIAPNPSYRSNSLLIRGEGSTRSVRSRSEFDLESNLAQAHLSSTPPINSYSTTHHTEHSSSGTLEQEWNHIDMDPAHGRIAVSGNSTNNVSLEIGGERHPDVILGRNNLVPQGFRGNSYSQRSSPPFRDSSSTLHLGPIAPSDEELQSVDENYSSRQPRPLSSIRWRSNDRNRRSRIFYERQLLLYDDAGLCDELSSEDFMIVERPASYGSRSMFDQHREMRLDIDNMSYEELLALGERIGNVSTGLSQDTISKSLTETIYHSPDQMEEERNCVICLDEFKNMDDIRSLKQCGHDFHASCIRKWLSMKNECPVCKASAPPDRK